MKKFLYYFGNFIVGSFVGFLIESFWCIFKNKKYESRKGLIYLPLVPMYGASAFFITIVVTMFKIDSEIWFFLVGALISTIIEYLSSVIQEKVFLSKSWDYKKMMFNLNGRVNLLYSLGFGICSLLWCKYVIPFIDNILVYTENSLIRSIVLSFYLLFSI